MAITKATSRWDDSLLLDPPSFDAERHLVHLEVVDSYEDAHDIRAKGLGASR